MHALSTCACKKGCSACMGAHLLCLQLGDMRDAHEVDLDRLSVGIGGVQHDDLVPQSRGELCHVLPCDLLPQAEMERIEMGPEA